ncbi:hypothetical protein Tco_1311964 [Tanacetum coccineum]
MSGLLDWRYTRILIMLRDLVGQQDESQSISGYVHELSGWLDSGYVDFSPDVKLQSYRLGCGTTLTKCDDEYDFPKGGDTGLGDEESMTDVISKGQMKKKLVG